MIDDDLGAKACSAFVDSFKVTTRLDLVDFLLALVCIADLVDEAIVELMMGV